MTPFSFQISDYMINGSPCKLIKLKGELDESNVDHHAETLYELIRVVSKGTHFVLDGKDLTYLNSKAIGYLTDWYNKLSQKGGKIFMVSLKPSILDVLDLVGITQIISVQPHLEDISL